MTSKQWQNVILGVVFIVAGVNHFINPAFYMAIMPPYLPAHLTLVYLSGALEVLGGLGVLVPAVRRLAGYGLILLMLAIFPANIYMAMNPDLFADIPPLVLYARLPLQFVIIGWIYATTRPPTPQSTLTP